MDEEREEAMGNLERCNLLLSKVKELKRRKSNLEGKIEKLNERISSENDRKKITNLPKLRRYCERERGKTVKDLIKIELRVKSEIKQIKGKRRQIEKKLRLLKEEMSILELEKEIGESLRKEEYLSQRRKLEKEIKEGEEERKRLAEVLDFYREALFKKLASSFWLYFEYFFLIKLGIPFRVVEFFRKDFARFFIVAFMVLLISCAFLLILKKEKIAEEVANVAYFSLVIGVVMEFILMMKQRKGAGYRTKDNAQSRR